MQHGASPRQSCTLHSSDNECGGAQAPARTHLRSKGRSVASTYQHKKEGTTPVGPSTSGVRRTARRNFTQNRRNDHAEKQKAKTRTKNVPVPHDGLLPLLTLQRAHASHDLHKRAQLGHVATFPTTGEACQHCQHCQFAKPSPRNARMPVWVGPVVVPCTRCPRDSAKSEPPLSTHTMAV